MLRSATADESLPPPWPSSLNPTSEAPMLGRGFINAHNFIYVPKPDGGRYATYTIDQSNAQRLAQVFQAKRPKTRRQNTFPCIVSSPQSKEQIHLQPLVGTADSGLFLTESTISRLNLRYTGLNEATRQGPAKVYSGVSLRFEGDLNESGSPCSYTFIQVYALPQAQRTMSKADPSSNVKRDGIIGLHHLVNHVVLSLHGDITLVERQMLQPNAELTKEFPPITLFRTALSPPTGTATIVWPLTPGMGPPSLPATPATPPSSAVLTPGDWPDIVSVPPTTLANVLAAFPPVQRDMIVTSLPTLSSAFGGGQRSPAIRLTLRTPLWGIDGCRACGNRDATLRVCRLCVDDRRPKRAVYCSKECQTLDWNTRHRLEHARHAPSRGSRNLSLGGEVDIPMSPQDGWTLARTRSTTVSSTSLVPLLATAPALSHPFSSLHLDSTIMSDDGVASTGADSVFSRISSASSNTTLAEDDLETPVSGSDNKSDVKPHD